MTENLPARIAVPWLARLDAVRARLEALAVAGAMAGLTEPDPGAAERWEATQVWAHLAEFPAYWVGEVRAVLDTEAGATPSFGRTKADPARVAAVERGRGSDVAQSAGVALAGCAAVETLLRAMDDADWSRVAVHPKLGPMAMERIVEEFLVGHLEEHAAQLDRLRGATL